jgi:hypothetical protein
VTLAAAAALAGSITAKYVAGIYIQLVRFSIQLLPIKRHRGRDCQCAGIVNLSNCLSYEHALKQQRHHAKMFFLVVLIFLMKQLLNTQVLLYLVDRSMFSKVNLLIQFTKLYTIILLRLNSIYYLVVPL